MSQNLESWILFNELQNVCDQYLMMTDSELKEKMLQANIKESDPQNLKKKINQLIQEFKIKEKETILKQRFNQIFQEHVQVAKESSVQGLDQIKLQEYQSYLNLPQTKHPELSQIMRQYVKSQDQQQNIMNEANQKQDQQSLYEVILYQKYQFNQKKEEILSQDHLKIQNRKSDNNNIEQKKLYYNGMDQKRQSKQDADHSLDGGRNNLDQNNNTAPKERYFKYKTEALDAQSKHIKRKEQVLYGAKNGQSKRNKPPIQQFSKNKQSTHNSSQKNAPIPSLSNLKKKKRKEAKSIVENITRKILEHFSLGEEQYNQDCKKNDKDTQEQNTELIPQANSEQQENLSVTKNPCDQNQTFIEQKETQKEKPNDNHDENLKLKEELNQSNKDQKNHSNSQEQENILPITENILTITISLEELKKKLQTQQQLENNSQSKFNSLNDDKQQPIDQEKNKAINEQENLEENLKLHQNKNEKSQAQTKSQESQMDLNQTYDKQEIIDMVVTVSKQVLEKKKFEGLFQTYQKFDQKDEQKKTQQINASDDNVQTFDLDKFLLIYYEEFQKEFKKQFYQNNQKNNFQEYKKDQNQKK